MSETGNIIAIPTFNRRTELEACLACLATADRLEDWPVVIGDDCSTDYDIADVVRHVPFAVTVLRNDTNLGCDGNTVSLLQTCLWNNARRVFLLDSDMIVSSDALSFAERNFGRTDGVLSLYNSVLHGEAEIVDGELVRKNSVGGAATVWDASVLKDMLEGLDGPHCWDWRVCDLAFEKGIALLVARQSRAQHIGIDGTNSLRFGELEYGAGFRIETREHAQAIAVAHEKLMLSQGIYRPPFKPSLLERWRRSIVKRLPKKRPPENRRPALGVLRKK
ncbi:glycosyltransferase family 2 protein [Hoeflea poritis]|uniref:Glycosyltransferase n=1 Tax=Hoeflea poritis TaxID=2993659 RepID=A0ABT4VR19_9HYPH|nr:glycosyltransferase family 2 protein [Hoeflea poritis]MDA4847152.1 glycosyltransferase [Hoeflea poritis]